MSTTPTGEVNLTRQELYEMVWATPMRTLAAKYGLSDVGLAKVCRRHEIPRPPVGYWAKKEHGKAVRQTPLQEVSDIRLGTISLGRSAVSECEPHEAEPRMPRAADLAALVVKEQQRSGPIVVPETLRSPHPVIARTRDALLASIREKRFDRYGMTWPSHDSRNQCIGVSIGKDSVPRAMRILNTLIRALEERGFSFQVKLKEQDIGPRIVGYGTSLVVSMSEKSVRSEHELTSEEKARLKKYGTSWHPRCDFKPCGRLTLAIRDASRFGHGHECKDTKRTPLENQLSDMVAEVPFIIDQSRQLAIAAEESSRRWAEDQRRRFEEEERRRKEAARVQAIIEEAGAWQRSCLLRDYADTVRSETIDRLGRLDEGSEMDNWLRWVNSVADQLDPLEKRCPKPTPSYGREQESRPSELTESRVGRSRLLN